MNVWIELKYGVGEKGVTICRLDHPYLLAAFKRCALRRAKEFTDQSEGIDNIIHLKDRLELENLETLLELLIPDSESDDGI